MRAAWICALAAGIAVSACATRPRPAVAAGCPPLTDEQWGPVVFRTLQETFGKNGYHVIVDHGADARGDLVLTASRIGPAKFAMPEPGRGGGLLIVLEPCTAKVLKVRKLRALEPHPLPLERDEESGL